MKAVNLVSVYTKKKYRNHTAMVNESQTVNIVNSEFTNRQKCEVIVSDVTYVRINNTWGYICILMDLFNQEIIGNTTEMHKTANLVTEAFANITTNLNNIKIFPTDPWE